MTRRSPSSSRTGTALVGADELGQELAGGGDLLLLDVRWTLAGSDREAYRAAHLPGAVFVDLDADLAGPPGDGGRHPLPSAEAFGSTMRRLGVALGRAAVVYDGGGAAPQAAARAWWCLRYFGHEAVRVLDGGFEAWRASGGEVQSGEVEPVPDTTAQARPGGMPVVSLDDIDSEAVSLMDVRAPERFSGASEPIDPVAGHIPGALNLPVSTIVDGQGRLLSPDGLGQVLSARAGDGEPAAYCGSGVAAAVLVLALHEAGTSAALYPGSWSEWIRDPSRPIATGS